MNELIIILWKFSRGDIETTQFESLLYQNENFEEKLPEELHSFIIEVNFKDRNAVYNLRLSLSSYLRKKYPLDCQCHTIRDLDRVAMGTNLSHLIFDSLEEKCKRGEQYWWLSFYRCKVCLESWIVAQDEDYDDFYFNRVSCDIAQKIIENKWPVVFESYEKLSQEVKESSIFSRY